MDVRYHTIIRQISVCLSVCLSVCPSEIRFPRKPFLTVNFKIGQCVARNPTMCLLHLSLYGCGQNIQLNDFGEARSLMVGTTG